MLAVIRLGREAVPELVVLMQNQDASVRFNAIKAVEFLGRDAEAAVPALKEASADIDPRVRLAAISALRLLTAKMPSPIAPKRAL
jgi:HEAT repeat protein